MLWDERTEHIGSERPFLSQMTRFLPWITRTYKKPPRGAMPVESSAIEGDMGPLMVETVDPAYDPRGEPPRGVDGTLQHDMFVFYSVPTVLLFSAECYASYCRWATHPHSSSVLLCGCAGIRQPVIDTASRPSLVRTGGSTPVNSPMSRSSTNITTSSAPSTPTRSN